MPTTYTFSKQYMQSIVDHAAGCGMEVVSLALVASTYEMTCDSAFDDDQYSHLQSFTDINRII